MLTTAQRVIDDAAGRGVAVALEDAGVPVHAHRHEFADGSTLIISPIPDGIRVHLGRVVRRAAQEPAADSDAMPAVAVGDRITFRAVTRHGAAPATRVVTGVGADTVEVTFHGWTGFVVRRDEIIAVHRQGA